MRLSGRQPRTRPNRPRTEQRTDGDRRVALLRGINVGRAKRVAMADLRALVEGLGYGDVRTLLNSGNVVFTVPPARRADAGARIEQALAGTLGVSSRVTVLTARELATVLEENPFADADAPSRLLVAFLRNPPDRRRLTPLLDQQWGADRLGVGTRVAFLWCPDGILASRLLESVGRALGDAVTMRNWATVTKLDSLASARTAS